MSVEIRDLTAEEAAAIEATLNLLAHMVGAPPPTQSSQLEALYDRIMRSTPRNEVEVIALGIGFGEELRWHGDYEWVRIVCTTYEETSIAVRGVMVFCHPISMIQKRLETGEMPDFVQLRECTINMFSEMLAGGNIEER